MLLSDQYCIVSYENQCFSFFYESSTLSKGSREHKTSSIELRQVIFLIIVEKLPEAEELDIS